MTRKSRRQFPGASAYRDRHGKRRWRFRRKGVPSVELGTEYASDEFVRRYEAAASGRGSAGAGSERTKPGSLSALVASYYQTPGFLDLAPSTMATYRNMIERLREAHGTKRISQLKRRHVMALLAEKKDTPSAANNLRDRLKTLLDHAIELEWRDDNPVDKIKPYKTDSTGFHTWSEEEIEKFYVTHLIGTLPHTAMTLMLYTGAARSDVVRLAWANIDKPAGRLKYRRKMTERSGGVLINIPIHKNLWKVINACSPAAFTFLETRDGKSRSPNGFGNMMREWCDQAGLPNCTSHGLRKAIARRLAEAGASPHEIAAVTGHLTLAEVERYTRDANRSTLADGAFGKLK